MILQIDPDGPGIGVEPRSTQCYLSSDLTPPILKSCADLRIAGYSINKEYLIDPDGANVGVDPFHVYCDMLTGTFVEIATKVRDYMKTKILLAVTALYHPVGIEFRSFFYLYHDHQVMMEQTLAVNAGPL